MRSLVKLMLIVGLAFATTFLIAKATGLLTIEQIETWLIWAKAQSPWIVGGIVAALLFADMFVAVPTLTVTILSGYFLGPVHGSVAALTGFYLAGLSGYALSRVYGDAVLKVVLKDPAKRADAIGSFQKHGFAMILLSRAVPILPEVTACLSGMSGMSLPRFALAWSLSSVPYGLIAVHAGSISTLDAPMPAILAAIGLSGTLWLGWAGFHRYRRRFT